MRHAVTAFAAATVLAGLASPALAQQADVPDVRCLLVLQTVSRDAAQREKASMGVFYYLGRLGARGPLSRIEPTMLAEGKKLTAQQAQVELTRCGNELSRNGSDLQAMNARLSQQVGASPAPASKAAPAPAKK